ncbi:tetratricopeptide repeat protein [Polaribacter vadi]|uniref:tetratricopeptide repeat protein n=1 Tax=Polaribacter TaxID=52959 RepID=UPI001C09B8B9|nr:MULTISPECIES: tetratricopeptide repeat protein [Polaribacter]MBU3012973.1 tetratricopeptide repeat protein [Polaribacter vadi]MDO6742791.1 tetratricopeptide repeat protein [Polaribacter sp. 1_MG-2023]
MSLTKFESMLKTNAIYFFDLVEFEEIIIHYLDAGKHKLAKKAVQLGLEQHPESIDLKFLRVELYIFENELDKASSLLKKIELIEPNNDELFIQKATIKSKLGNHKDAIINLEKALTFTEDKVDVWSLMGMEYLYLDDFENARLSFTKCIDVDYEDYSALYNIVYCFDMEKEHEQAIKYLNNYIDINPYCEVAWHQLGRQYFMLDNFKEALTAFDYAVIIDEHFIGGYLEKAKTLEELKDYEKAIENYLITLELDDPTAFAYVRIGECYEKLNKYEEAVSFYKKAVHEDPLLDRAWVLLTNLFFNQENYEKASYYISKAIKIDENNSVYWRRYSEIKIKLNFYEEAVTGYENCLELNDNALVIYIALSDVLSFLGEFDKAVNLLIKAQKTYKDFAEVEYRLAGLFFILDKEKYGFNHLISAMKVDYEYHSILNELFPTVYDDKKVQKLLTNYKKALE